ncbi:hypothetical protein TNCV_3486021 [Trichonephila clavipes]|nr:hypothetical protein TNCV_3486021 [Trichonephila clavipes]
MTSARGHGAIVYCLNSGSDDIQNGSHNGGLGAGLSRAAGAALTGGGGETRAAFAGAVADLIASAFALAASCISLRFLALRSQKLTLGEAGAC